MRNDAAGPTAYAPMPPLGTTRVCVFCRNAVSLQQVLTGWHHWLAPRDTLEGRWHCDGGHPGYKHAGPLLTLHIPVPPAEDAPFAPRYAADGAPHHPQS